MISHTAKVGVGLWVIERCGFGWGFGDVEGLGEGVLVR